MWDRYRDWMHAWETRLNARDKNRVVRPFEWGLDWTEQWPVVNGTREAAPANPAAYLAQLNQQIVSRSDDFYAYQTPSDFRLEGDFLLFTSPVHTPHPVNNLARARWFPSGKRRALIVMPQWNSDAEGHNGLCRIFNKMGISALRLSLPYHDYRKPAETERADYAVSANIGRTIDAGRQAVIDARSCARLAGSARLHGIWNRRHQPGFLLRFSRQRARRAPAREPLQPFFRDLRRRGVDGPIHAPRTAGH